MDVNGVSQVMSSYETTKADKTTEAKQTEQTKQTNQTNYDAGKAAEYTKSNSSKKAPKSDMAVIEKLKAEAEQRTAQMRSLVEKMLSKQGKKFTSFADTFDQIKKGLIQVDPAVSAQAQKDISEDGYWGVEQTSERLFSFAKALAGNDPAYADKMLEAMKKGFEQATKSWGGELPDICQRTIDAATEKINNWKNGTASTEVVE